MLTGIRVAVSRCSGMMKKIHDEDFKSTKKLTFNMDGNELTPSSKYDFKFKDYCPEVFRDLRSLFGVDPADYLISITGKYILSELGSPGKSGSFFYYSRDFRFIIKTIHHSEHKQLRRILKDYYHHVKSNPNTLISQFYGLHRLKVRGSIKKVHFIYDLKGSTWGRYTKIPLDKEGLLDSSHTTLKDLNWLEQKEKIMFGPKKRRIFLEQLRADVQFLKNINAMDYSLLLGIHDVQKGNSTTITNLSVFDPKSNSKNDLIKTNPRDIDREADLPARNFPGRSKYIFYGHDGGIRGTNEENEPTRVIYYLGIIDCLTHYSIRKKLETLFRSVGQNRSTISAITSTEPTSLIVSAQTCSMFQRYVGKSSQRSFASLELNGVTDWAILQKDALQVYGGPSLVVGKHKTPKNISRAFARTSGLSGRPRTGLSTLGSRGFTFIGGRGVAALAGHGQVFAIKVKENEEILINKHNLLSISVNGPHDLENCVVGRQDSQPSITVQKSSDPEPSSVFFPLPSSVELDIPDELFSSSEAPTDVDAVWDLDLRDKSVEEPDVSELLKAFNSSSNLGNFELLTIDCGWSEAVPL
ncbi:uncharacterized protein CXQ87_004797 [Candidozyma duobushaemuli]|uniref:1-phosphatidylinositol-4-phosphate 5-kinase n=1 Tax=Candidozyma duobushaemuli TaxID=1231522 RepID=A0A2V1AG28_9ASCO|nr:uncharacterized protein CXQ87_004797 [[Candida] duobushaemulonis]PVH16504.1 hypothetical protein CXQ87_004797 [[Candida] duobushaemulonis]